MKFSTLFFALLSSSVVNGLIANPRAESIQDCLGNKNVPVYWPASPNYTELAEPFNLRLQYKPAVIVLPETAKHVQDAVVCAGEFNLKVSKKKNVTNPVSPAGYYYYLLYACNHIKGRTKSFAA